MTREALMTVNDGRRPNDYLMTREALMTYLSLTQRIEKPLRLSL